MSPLTDSSQRFLFDGADVRGESVHIAGALGDMLANQTYSHALKSLLGEFAAAAVLARRRRIEDMPSSRRSNNAAATKS